MHTVCPKKAEENQTRFTVGGDHIKYPNKVATPTAEMLVAKLLFSIAISTKGKQISTKDISNLYIMTPLSRLEYICIKLSDIPKEIIYEYKLMEKAKKMGQSTSKLIGMYGLPQSGLLANLPFEKRLNPHGYQQGKLVPGLAFGSTPPRD